MLKKIWLIIAAIAIVSIFWLVSWYDQSGKRLAAYRQMLHVVDLESIDQDLVNKLTIGKIPREEGGLGKIRTLANCDVYVINIEEMGGRKQITFMIHNKALHIVQVFDVLYRIDKGKLVYERRTQWKGLECY